MKDSAIIKVRFPFEDNDIPNISARVKKIESFFYNIFHLFVKRPEVCSFEIIMIKGVINFYIVAPRAQIASVTAFLFSEFYDAEINEVEQYDNSEAIPDRAVAFHPKLIGSEAFSLRTVQASGADPLGVLFNALSELPPTDAVLYQVILDPIDESLEERGGSVYGLVEKAEVTETKPRFSTTMRLIYFTSEGRNLKERTAYFENAFSSFSTERNYLKVNMAQNVQAEIDAYFAHKPDETGTLTSEEISSLYHPPDPWAKIRGMDWLFSRKAEPPMNLPTPKNTPEKEISTFGITNFRGKEVEFGIRREDRRRHLYVVGKSGVGKSKLLEKLIMDDMRHGKGICVIDPHGDLIQNLLYRVPENRIDDVVYFSPSDLDWPIAFNPIENVTREFKQQVTQGLIEIFKKFFGGDWTPKIEHVFRFTVLALLDFKKSTLMGMQKMLTDRPYRQMVISEIQDHVVKKFWANEFSSWSEKFDNEAIVPLVNKLGQFLSNEMVRNIVAQSKNKVDFDAIMNKEKILFVELSKGKLGEENSALLGSLIITKIEQQGMARAFVTQQERKDFYLYVDEFQNFATKTFDNILSEARKYRLDLTVSHQYLGQLLSATRETVFGNVGSIITFRLGADDASYIAKELAPRFSANDVMNLGVRELYTKMSIVGMVTPAFSALTVNVDDPDPRSDIPKRCIEASRKKFATPVAEVQKELDELEKITESPGGAGGEAGKEADFDAPLV